MKEEKVKIIDDSGDKKYFTQLPHYILNHSNANDQALYWQMKRYSGENGMCFATEKTLMKKLGIGKKAYDRSLKYLLDKKWVKFIGMTNGKTRPIKTYVIVDIWKLNILHYEEISSESTLSFKGDKSQKHTKLSSESTVEEEPSKEEQLAAKADEKEFSFKEKLQLMEKDPKRHIQIICLYWKFKNFMVENKEQYQTLMRRDLKSATRLVGFSDEQILEIMEYLENENTFKWTMESILKYIGERLDRIKPIK